jgi:hypothetical protein
MGKYFVAGAIMAESQNFNSWGVSGSAYGATVDREIMYRLNTNLILLGSESPTC